MANALAWVRSGVSYVVQEDFETAGPTTGWSYGTPTGSTWDNVVSPLEGTGDYKLIGGNTPTTHGVNYTFSSTLSECWVVAMLKPINLPSAGLTNWFGLFASTFANLCYIRLSSTGTVDCFNDSGAAVGTMASSVVAGTLYYCKIHYKTGTGANSVSSYELSTSGTFINSGGFYVSTTTGVSTTDAGILFLRNSVDGEFRFDHVRVSLTDLGNSFSNWP